MSRPYSVARGRDLETKALVQGAFSEAEQIYFIRHRDKLFIVDGSTLEFNTGLIARGIEIFTGDILQDVADDERREYTVEYLVEEGALFIAHTEHETSYRPNDRKYGEDVIRTDRTQVVHERLTAARAARMQVVGSRHAPFEPSGDE